MRIVEGRPAEEMVHRLATRGGRVNGLERGVRRIVDSVRYGGDRLLRQYAKRWDGLAAKQPFRIDEKDMAAALEKVAPSLLKSLRQAAANIRRFCEWQKPKTWMRTRAGISLGQLVRPLDSVG